MFKKSGFVKIIDSRGTSLLSSGDDDNDDMSFSGDDGNGVTHD